MALCGHLWPQSIHGGTFIFSSCVSLCLSIHTIDALGFAVVIRVPAFLNYNSDLYPQLIPNYTNITDQLIPHSLSSGSLAHTVTLLRVSKMILETHTSCGGLC